MKEVFRLLIFMCVVCLNASAQDVFTSNRDKFVKEFQKLMNESTSINLNGFTKDKLEPILLESTRFSDAYFLKLVKTANFILEKKLKAYPEVYNYVFSVYSLVEQNQPEDSYIAWNKSVDKLLSSRNPKKFKEFVAMSAAFFDKQVISSDKNFEWCFIGGSYSFSYSDKYPILELKEGKLICRSFNTSSRTNNEIPFGDSIVISNTSGLYNPILEKWEGNGGVSTWEKVGFPAKKTFAEFSNYSIYMRSALVSADSVLLTTPYFERKLIGSFSDGAKKGAYNEKSSLNNPQFLSYETVLKINNLVQEVDYEGGFSLKGTDFVGVGNNENPVRLTFKRNNIPFIKTQSQLLNVSPTKLSAQNCQVTLSVGEKDSIWHPGLSIDFLINDDRLEIKRGNTGIAQVPFSNSYHQLDMYVEQIVWDRSKVTLDFDFSFSSPQEQRIARFESKSFYDQRLYDLLQGQESVHPLVGLSKYAYKYDEYTFNEGKAALAIGRTITQAKPVLLQLSNLGFIAYDTERGIVSINDKLDSFINARTGKKDYDNISFVSDLRPKRMDGVSQQELMKDKNLIKQKEFTEEHNRKLLSIKSYGNINLANLELNLNQVASIPISEKQFTTIFPENNVVTIRQNRNFIFTGWVNAGKWEIKISDGNYNYEENKINILASELAVFRAVPQRREDGDKLIPIQSEISNLVGAIYVDDVNNRAGDSDNSAYQKYPYLVSTEKTKVYYEKPSIFRNAYDKKRFYFELEPFTIDSLDNFSEATQYFKGELTSAGIFPKFYDSLKLMADYSLGLVRQAPKGGFEFYGSEAKYDNKIVLSGNGLQGSGEIDFINSTSKSNAFTFLPDSTVGLALFENRPQEDGVAFPDVKSESAYVTYIPKNKVLKASATRLPLEFFNGEAKLKGTAIITPGGMTGFGYMDFANASLGSENFKFNRWDIDADTSVFNLRNVYKEEQDVEEDSLAFITDNVQSSVSFKDRKGVFRSNEGESTVIFPINKYLCKMDQFTWLMDQAQVELESSNQGNVNIDSHLDLVGPNFYSIHPKQDSLQFRAPKAIFNLKEKSIFCSKTEYIDVADARIYPDSAKLTIRKNAKMDPLLNSKIVANYITKYHQIINATTNITARRAYTSVGDYTYYDVDSNLYLISLDRVELDSSYQTRAIGKIDKEDEFKLSNQFDFYGDIIVNAAQQEINFSGATRLEHDCEKFSKNWLAFSAPLDLKNIQIPVSDTMKDLEGNQVSSGIVWRNSLNTDSVALYPTFLSVLDNQDDPIVITASGFLQYEHNEKEYQISSKTKLMNRAEVGNYISLHVPTCGLNGDGIIDLGMDYGDVKVENIGIVNYVAATDKTTLNISTKISTPLDKGIMEEVADRINGVADLPKADFNSNTLEDAVSNWVGIDVANVFKSDYILKGELKKIPKPMQETFVFSGVNLASYSIPGDPQKGLRTNLDNALLVNMYSKPIMKYVPFKLFAEQKNGGDQLSFLIDLPGSNLYFFQYAQGKKEGVMNILTSDLELKTTLSEMKEDKMKIKRFQYRLSTESIIKNKFLRIFNR